MSKLFFGIITISCVAAFSFAEPKKSKVPSYNPSYDVRLIVMIKGTDGTLSLIRDDQLPFIPRVGDTIDSFVVESVGWATRINSFVIGLNKYVHDGKCKDFAKIMLPESQGWKELTYFPKEVK